MVFAQQQLNRRLYRVIVQVACTFVASFSMFALRALGLVSAPTRDAGARCATPNKQKLRH